MKSPFETASKKHAKLAVCLRTPDANGYNITPILWGAPGHGKSSSARAIASSLDGARFYALTASLYSAEDFGGLPQVSPDRSCFSYLAPEWSRCFLQDTPGILLVDDITTCSPRTQQALFRLILERRVADFSLPPSVLVVAAANDLNDLDYQGTFTRPLGNRFVHIPWMMEPSELAFALENSFSTVPLCDLEIDESQRPLALSLFQTIFASFLRRMPELFCSSGDSRAEEGQYQYAFPSPRTIDMAIRLSATCQLLGIAPGLGVEDSTNEDSVFLELLFGSIGEAAGIAFFKFLRNQDFPDPQKVLDGEALDLKKLRDDSIHMLFVALSNSLLSLSIQKATKFLPASLRMLELISQIDKDNRIDCVYGSILRLVRDGGWIVRAEHQAKQSGMALQLQSAIAKAFGEETHIGRIAEKMASPSKPSKSKKRSPVSP